MNVFRYQIPVDHSWHEVVLSGPIVHVACRNGDPGVVHFWALANVGTPWNAYLRVFDTGQPVPEDAVYRGTGIAEPMVRHLFEQA